MVGSLSWNTSNAAKVYLHVEAENEERAISIKRSKYQQKRPSLKLVIKLPKMSYETLLQLPVTVLYPWCDIAHCLLTALQTRKDQKDLFR